MRIKVTKQHIEQGLRCHSDRCPLSLALADMFGQGRFQVGCAHAFEVNTATGRAEGISLPGNAVAFRAAFDAGQDVEPFTFDFTPPPRD